MICGRLISSIMKQHGNPLFVPLRTHWNRDFKPGMFPKTHRERVEAAAKYNLQIEDYEPYANDGQGFGDYPKLPDISEASKDSYYPWDFPESKRNFKEPIHVDADHFSEDRYDIDQYYKLRPSFNVQLLQSLGAMILWGVLIWAFEDCKMFPAVTPKQFPHQGKTHYRFEEREDNEDANKEPKYDKTK